MKSPSEDDVCYACYGIHYLDGKMRMNGDKAKCIGLSVKTDVNSALVDRSRTMDLSLKPGVTVYSVGKTQFTGKMHRLGTPPFCSGVQFSRVQNNPQQSESPVSRNTKDPVNNIKPDVNTEESKPTVEERLIRFQESVGRSEEKFFRSLRNTFLATADDFPGKVARSTGKFVHSTFSTGTKLTNYLLRSLGWK